MKIGARKFTKASAATCKNNEIIAVSVLFFHFALLFCWQLTLKFFVHKKRKNSSEKTTINLKLQ